MTNWAAEDLCNRATIAPLTPTMNPAEAQYGGFAAHIPCAGSDVEQPASVLEGKLSCSGSDLGSNQSLSDTYAKTLVRLRTRTCGQASSGYLLSKLYAY
eukprot:6462868-Amphidinium_carterae.2